MNLNHSFSGNHHQPKYFNYIKTLIHVLQKRLLRFYQNRACNQPKFFSLLHKLIQKIGKYEQTINHEVIFHDSVNTLLEQISPYDHEQFKRMKTGSEISFGFDDNISTISHQNSSRLLPVAKFKSKTQQTESYETYRNKKYHSHQTIKPRITSIHELVQPFSTTRRSRSTKFKDPEMSRIKGKLQPPKITPYINTIKQEIKNEDRISKRGGKIILKESYMGQRRAKVKRNVRPGIFY